MDEELRNPLLRWLIFGHLWVSLAVAAQIMQTGLLMHAGAPLRRYALASFLGAFALYGATRLARLGGPEAPAYINLRWYVRHRGLMLALVALAGASAAALIWPLWPRIGPVMAPAIVLTVLYVTPFTSGKGRGIGLRTVPFLKAVLIAVVWGSVAVAAPLRLDPAEVPAAAILGRTAGRVPLILALAILFDIRDRATDDPALRTVPLVLGTAGAKTAALALLVCSAALEAHALVRHGSAGAAWGLLPGYAFAAALAVRAMPRRDPFYYGILVDGAMIAIPLGAALGALLW